MLHLLFICSRNQWRSPTAEKIYNRIPGISVRSAGTEPSARVRLTQSMLDAADMIFVMEHKHKKRIMQMFDTDREIIVLDIPDEYQYMDEELIAMIKETVDAYIDL